MQHSFLKRLGGPALARVSVTGSGGVFHVRIGSGKLVDTASVREERGALRCSCGRRNCVHIESLLACGFYDVPYDKPTENYPQAEAA